MNEKFFNLPQERQDLIRSSAILEFGEGSFKKTSADAIAKRLGEIDIFDDIKTMDYDEAVKAGLIEVLGAETDEKFLSNVMAQVNDKETVAKTADSFKMVYTPFHGTGHKLIPEALGRLGVKHLLCVPEQMVIDGDFPTVVSPNPENPEGFYLAVDLAKKEGADFILGSDPDADRVGIMVRTRDGEFKVITGNQTGVLLLDYLIGAKKAGGPDAGKAGGPEDHRHHGDGPEGGGGQRPPVLRHLHRLQVPGGEDGQAGKQRRRKGHLLL